MIAIPLPGLAGPAMTQANAPPGAAKRPAGGERGFGAMVAALLGGTRDGAPPHPWGVLAGAPASAKAAAALEGDTGTPASAALRLDRIAGAEDGDGETPPDAAYAAALAAALAGTPAPEAVADAAPGTVGSPPSHAGTPAGERADWLPRGLVEGTALPPSSEGKPAVTAPPVEGDGTFAPKATPAPGGGPPEWAPAHGYRARIAAAAGDAPAEAQPPVPPAPPAPEVPAEGEPAEAALDIGGLQPATGEEPELTLDLASQDGATTPDGDVTAEASPDVATDTVDLEGVLSPQPAASGRAEAAAPAARTEPAAVADRAGFAGRLADTVRDAALVGDREVRLALDPPHLGRVHIRIEETANGLRVLMEAASGEAHEAIERALPALQSALEARDLKVERIQVQQQSPSSGAEAGDGQGPASDRGPRGDGGDGRDGGDEPRWSPIASMRREEQPVVARRERPATGALDVLA